MTEVGACGLFCFEEIADGDAADAVFEGRDVEIDEQAEGAAFEFKVGQELGVVDGEEFGHGLELDDELVLDDEIESIAAIECYAFVYEGRVALTFESETRLGEFEGQCLFIG